MMSIKPIDYNVMIPKSQEVSRIKHNEGEKHRNILDSTVVQQEKDLDRNKKRVMDTEKSSESKIKRDGEEKNQYMSNNKKRKKQGKKEEDEDKIEEKLDSNSIGKNIDIHI